MLPFMDYMLYAFGRSTGWNQENSYSALTATSDALLSFDTPKTLSLNVSSLSTPNFATAYTISTLGQIDGSISYLYTSHGLAHFPSQSTSIPLRCLIKGYRDLGLPKIPVDSSASVDGEVPKPTLAYAALALPPPTVLTALYARRLSEKTLLSLSVYSKSQSTPRANSAPPPASVLAHLQHDAGQYSVEGLASTDSALLGARGLWNFGTGPPSATPFVPQTDHTADKAEHSAASIEPAARSVPPPLDELAAYHNRLASKPNLLSAGAEFYYSPFSHVIGMSTGLRFTTLAPHITPAEPGAGKPLAGTAASLLAPSNLTHSSFPYTMTLTINPLVGSFASTYSVRPTPNLALSSRCDFNFYSWESQYVVGAEIWRGTSSTPSGDDPLAWAKLKLKGWFSAEEQTLKDERFERENENVLKLRVDDSLAFKALWCGRVKSLLANKGMMAGLSHDYASEGLRDRFPVDLIDPLLLAADKAGFQALFGPNSSQGEKDPAIVYIQPRPGCLIAPGARKRDPMSIPSNLSPYAALKAQYGLLPSAPNNESKQASVPFPTSRSRSKASEQQLNQQQGVIALDKPYAPAPAPLSHVFEPSSNSQYETGSPTQGSLVYGQSSTPSYTPPPGVGPYEPPDVTAVRMALAVSVFPPYHAFPLNTTVNMSPEAVAEMAAAPVQGHLPPHMLPHHPVFLYFGRDLSKPHMPLPRRGNESPFFVRRLTNCGDWTDRGYGPGVEISEVYRTEVEEEERRALEHYLTLLTGVMEQGHTTV
ncbi:hypothetical protein DV736_g3378, partial [Chaetothyriales sp. CBS 134916]